MKPEHRKQVSQLLTDGGDGETIRLNPKNAMPETLRRDLASDRLQIARLEIAKQPQIALDLLIFHVASSLLGKRRVSDGPDIQFKLPKQDVTLGRENTSAGIALAALEQSLSTVWLKHESDADRFEADDHA